MTNTTVLENVQEASETSNIIAFTETEINTEAITEEITTETTTEWVLAFEKPFTEYTVTETYLGILVVMALICMIYIFTKKRGI